MIHCIEKVDNLKSTQFIILLFQLSEFAVYLYIDKINESIATICTCIGCDLSNSLDNLQPSYKKWL